MIIVATEGSETEKIYFDKFESSRLQVRTIPSIDGNSSPEAVLLNLQGFVAEYQLGNGDELWLAVDVDRWKEKMLGSVSSLCVQKRINLAISNPCFELWLALHFESHLPNPVNSRSLERHIRKELGSFQKSNYDAEKIILNLSSAVKRAKILDDNPGHRWPQKVGTHIYRLVESISEKLKK